MIGLLALLRTSGPAWVASLALARVGLPALKFWPERVYPFSLLQEQVAAILSGWGMPAEHVPITLEHLLYADLHGIDSHGCGMLGDYHRSRGAGRVTMTPEIRIVREGTSTALLDGGGGLGHVPGDRAMRLALTKCRETGIGAVAVRNSGHFGAAGTYAAMATREGLVGLATTNTGTPAVVPTFGVEAMLGTNPIAFAAPAGRNRPFLLDMATSTTPVGKLSVAWRRGEPIPAGWAMDPVGRPLTNPRRAIRHRRLTPLGSTRTMGSHKGYGLAAMVEILSSVLPGPPGVRCADPHPRVGHFFLAIDPGRFRDAGGFETDLDAMLDGLRASRPADPHEPVLVAGDPEYAERERRLRDGVPLSRSVVEDIRRICRDTGVPFLLEKGVRRDSARR